MEDRAERLLNLPDKVLFTHGGCHVFALALRAAFQYPMLWIRDSHGNHDHIACEPAAGNVLDYFGNFSRVEYIKAEIIYDKVIKFTRIEQEELQDKFTCNSGTGYYVHRDFFDPAMERAQNWINLNRQYFDGTKRAPIPNLSRIYKE